MDDIQIRNAAFLELKKRVDIHGQPLPWSEIVRTFRIGDEEVYIANRARGIFRPRQMKKGVLSVKSTLPRAGRFRRYVDDRRDEALFYSLQGSDPTSHDNQYLKEAYEEQTPFIYFHGVAPGSYEALWPAYITKWNPEKLRVEIQLGTIWGSSEKQIGIREEERRYRTQIAKQRIHQSSFREMVLSAYDNCCALTRLPVKKLLDAAHIYPDGHLLGRAKVTNGIAMSTLHHVAYDSNLLGIDPNGKITISERLSEIKDGPLLEFGLKDLHNSRIAFPKNSELRPDKDALAYRFEEFKSAH